MSYRPFTNYEQFIYLSRYSRWIEKEGRREKWPETVERVVSYFKKRVGDNPGIPWDRLEYAILNRDVMPSMRVMMTAGLALDQNDIAAYNCSFLEIDSLESFGEVLYVLMHGTGLGFSVTEESVSGIREISVNLGMDPVKHTVGDSKEGWRDSVQTIINCLASGIDVDMDYSLVRAAGERLNTFGGRASGPAPLKDLHEYIRRVFAGAQGRQLTSVECHGIVCKIAEVVVVGGVRRSALISLSDLGDDSMRDAKSGQWWKEHSEYALANNSAIYERKPSKEEFDREWLALKLSGSGERGIFNKSSAAKKSREIGRAEGVKGTNPCGEILLRDGQFCNLTEVILRPGDDKYEILEKVEIATIMGTLQSTLTNIHGLRQKWVENTSEERLLGVSMTGIMDNKYTRGDDMEPGEFASFLDLLRVNAREANAHYAHILDIPASAAITTVKPSGTVSQLCGTSSGIHPSHAESYIRRVRQDIKDPLTKMMIDKGVPGGEDFYNPNSHVFEFGVERKGSVTRDSLSAIEFLDIWLMYKKYYTDHNPSVTISVKDHEWESVGEWVYNNFDEVGGLSFLPYDGGSYKQAPYEVSEALPHDAQVDWDDLVNYETTNSTTDEKGLACSAGLCEI